MFWMAEHDHVLPEHSELMLAVTVKGVAATRSSAPPNGSWTATDRMRLTESTASVNELVAGVAPHCFGLTTVVNGAVCCTPVVSVTVVAVSVAVNVIGHNCEPPVQNDGEKNVM